MNNGQRIVITGLGALSPNGIGRENYFAAVADGRSGIRTITGSPIGSPSRIREMLDVAARHRVKAHTERFPMAKANEAIERVKKNKVRYRAVLAN